MEFWIWLIIIGLFILAEVVTDQLISIWFALGALAAMIVSVIVDMPDMSIWLELTAFVVVSAAALIATRPLVKKFLQKKQTPTNADRAIGEVVVVTEDINNLLAKGAVTVFGTPWTARSANEMQIPAGTSVVVEKIEGVKLFVRPISVNSNQ
ncbi:MAG: NfeD family protein [Oscillospiraceae bacterium]|nr:NfeD family protein [Oscillospiraceae bacterium]